MKLPGNNVKESPRLQEQPFWMQIKPKRKENIDHHKWKLGSNMANAI